MLWNQLKTLTILFIFTLYLLAGATASDSSAEAAKITSYDPGELLSRIFNPNVTITSRQRGYGLVFEDQSDPQSIPEDQSQYGLVTFDENNKLKFEEDIQDFEDNPLRFEDNSGQNNDRPLKFEENDQVSSQNQVQFKDDNAIDQNKRKKRRRRRKPKKVQSYQGHLGYSGVPGGPEFPGPAQGLGPNPYPGYPIPVPFKRRRRPRPSLATEALTAVTGALTSIALYDDYQCVPRLLCEAAGGGSLGVNGVLNSIAGIQPLLTLLSAYNGLSSSPLFVFGRAVFLGMTSKGNTGTCRYAYPQCPNDPEQLIHYLNNHNGGFFRFFNAPLPNQNLEQFYNHLGQNGQFNFEQGYGNPSQQAQESYGLYQNQQGYGFQNERPSLYGNQNYGSNYAYDYNTYGNNIRYKDATIQKRIQNKPLQESNVIDNNDNFEDDDKTKWLFPDEPQNTFDDNADGSLKFPEESKNNYDPGDLKRKGKSILFPENKYNPNYYSNKMLDYHTDQNDYRVTRRPYYQNNNYNNNQKVVNANIYKYSTTTPFNENDYYYDHKHNFYVKKDPNKQSYNNNNNKINNYYHNNNQNNNYNKNQNQGYYNNPRPVNYGNYNDYASSKVNNDGVQTVYIVRGNGDPSRPEVVKVRPGQTVH